MSVAPPSLLALKARRYKDGELFHIIREGRGLMGSYLNQIPDKKTRWAIVNYIRELQRAEKSRTRKDYKGFMDSSCWNFFKDRQKLVLFSFLFLAFITFCVGLLYDPKRIWLAYLVGFFMVTSFSLGSLFFLAIQVLTGATWSINVRRFFEGFASATLTWHPLL